MRHRDGAWRMFQGMGGGTVDLDGARAAVVNLREVTEQRRAEQRLVQNMEAAIGALAAAAELRDPHAAGGQRRVAALAEAIARELKLDEMAARGVRIAATVHDVGKVQVPAEILGKPSRLTDAEYSLVKAHAQAGADLLKNLDLPWPIAEIVLQHHEAPDGSGYPRGLKGGAILLEARIVAVADAVEAMLSRHPYRPAQSVDATLAEITRHRGAKFDPQVVDACVKLFREKGYILAT
jgi:putative nucleotidyltransferase with HDIG domain